MIDPEDCFSQSDETLKRLSAFVNNLAVGQTEACLSQLRLAQLAAKQSPPRGTRAANDLIASMHQLLSSVKLKQVGSVDVNSMGQTTAAVSPAFRIAASSIAPSADSVVYALANSVGDFCEVDWDDELPVLIGVVIHALGNAVHGMNSTVPPSECSVALDSLMALFDFVLEHDGTPNTIDFCRYMSVLSHLDVLLNARENDESWVSGSSECSLGLLTLLWTLTSRFVSRSSYSAYFETLRGGSSSPMIAPYMLSPLRVVRSLTVFYPPPPTEEELAEMDADRQALRRSRSLAAKGDGFVRASQRVKRAAQLPRSIFSLRQDLFCVPSLVQHRDAVVDMLQPHPLLHTFMNEFLDYFEKASLATISCLQKPVPLKPFAKWAEYVRELVYCRNSTNLVKNVVTDVVEALCAPKAQAPLSTSQGPLTAPVVESFFAVAKSFLDDLVFAPLRPFVLYELYAKQGNRTRLFSSRFALTFQDHAVLIDYLASSAVAGAGAKAFDETHPCFTLINDIQLLVKVTSFLEKSQDIVGRVGFDSARVLQMLLDTHGDVVNYIIRGEKELGTALAVAPSSVTTPSASAASSKRTMFFQNLIAMFVAVSSAQAQFQRRSNNGALRFYSDELTAAVARQVFFLHAVVVVQFVFDHFTSADIPPPLQDFALVVRDFSDSAAKTEQPCIRGGAPVNSRGQFYETVIEIVVTVCAHYILLPALQPERQKPQGGDGGRRALSIFCNVVQLLQQNCDQCLSDGVKSSLNDVLFRAKQLYENRRDEGEFLASMEAALVVEPPRKGRDAIPVDAFAQSPYGFLLTAVKAKNYARAEEVLVNLFLRSQKQSRSGPQSDTSPHNALLFAYVAARLVYVQRHRISIDDFLSQLQALPSTGSSLFVPEELWFVDPSNVASSPAGEYVSRTLEQSIASRGVSGYPEAALIRRFTDAVQAILAGSDLALTDKDIFSKFLSPSLPAHVSRSVIGTVVSAVSRLSFMSATSSTTVDDLLTAVQQCEALAHPQEQYWTRMEPAEASSSSRAVASNPLCLFLAHLKALSTTVCLVDAAAPAHVEFLLTSGYQLLYNAAKKGTLLPVLQASDTVLSKRDILKIVLSELLVDALGSIRTSKIPSLGSANAALLDKLDVINILRVVEVCQSYPQALFVLHLLLADQAEEISPLLEPAKGASAEPSAWMRDWLALQQSRVRVMFQVEENFIGSQISGESDDEPASLLARRASLLLDKAAQTQHLSDLLRKLLLSHSVEATKQLIFALGEPGLPLIMSAVSALRDDRTRQEVQMFMIEALVSMVNDDEPTSSDARKGVAHSLIVCILLHVAHVPLRLSYLFPTAALGGAAAPADASAKTRSYLAGVIPHSAQLQVLEGTRDVLLAQFSRNNGEDDECRQMLEQTQARVLYLGRLQRFTVNAQNFIAAKRPRGSLTFGVRTISADPVSFDKVKNVLVVVDELLELGKDDALPLCCELLILATRSGLVTFSPEELQAIAKTFAALYLRKCIAFSCHLDVNASSSPPRRKTFRAKTSVGTADSKSDVQFLLDFLSVAKDELGSVDAFGSVHVLPPSNEHQDAPFCRAIMEEVATNSRLRLSSAFRLARLVMETPFLAPLFSGDSRWGRIIASLQMLNELQLRARSALREASQREEEDDEEGKTDLEADAAELGLFDSDKAFLTEPMLILENLVMGQRLNAVAGVLPIIRAVDIEACDKMLLLYAQKAVDLSHFDTIPEDEFPHGKALVRPQGKMQPLPVQSFTIHLKPGHSSAERHRIRQQFSFFFSPNVPLFRGLVNLCYNRLAANTRLMAIADQLFDSISDYSNLTMRMIAIDVGEQVLGAVSPPGPKELLLLGRFEIARHLVVCMWPAIPKLAELADRDYSVQLIADLVEKGQNKVAYAVAEKCGVDMQSVESLFVDRTTQLLTLGLYEEAAKCLALLPAGRTMQVISSLLLQMEFTPVPHQYRAHTAADGSYLVRQHHVSEIPPLTLKRQVGLRTLISRFGQPVDILSLHIRHREFTAALKIAADMKKEEGKLVECILEPLTMMCAIDAFQVAMKAYDRTLENLRFLIIAFCKHLEGNKRYDELLCWQRFMHDYARGAHTATLLAHNDLPCAKKLAYLAEAEELLINAKFQPTTKGGTPPHAEDGTVLPLSRLDGHKIQTALQQCRLQRDLISNLSANGLEFNKLTLYGDKEQLRGVVVELLVYGKNFFDLSMTIVSSFTVDVASAFGLAADQLLKTKKHDVIEVQMENLKRALIPEAEKNHAYGEIFTACIRDVINSKKSTKLAESVLSYMTTVGGHKVNCYLAQSRWKEAFEDAMRSKDNKAILAVYERAQEAPPTDEIEYVINNTRTYLARNAMR
jgi:hypothetical protein